MQNILFLVHRIPFPPNKGDKIRSFHFLKALSQHFNVYLGTFVDDEDDWRYRVELAEYCREVFCLPLNPTTAKIKSLSGLVSGEALSLPYYESRKMREWVDTTVANHGIEKAVIFSSPMGQYVVDKTNLKIYADFVDVDSDKWQQYARNKRWPESWIYQRESMKLLTYERKLSERASVTTFVSEQEANLFRRLVPECRGKITSVDNGVDIDYFNPVSVVSNPFKEEHKNIVFTGAMDYWANVDAVVWFAKEVFPKIIRVVPHARFYIVGSKPTKEVRALAYEETMIVTGRVEDIRPYLAHAAFAVAPLRIARGIQNKVLEAMAMEKKVLATSAAMEGIQSYDSQDVVVSDGSEEMAEQACLLLSQTAEQLVSRINRVFVESRFSWQSNGERLVHLIES